MSSGDDAALAIHGGPPVRERPFPCRALFGAAELEAVQAVFRWSEEHGQDFGFQGPFEAAYVEAFRGFQGGGFADAVSSGTAAVYLAVRAVLEKGDEGAEAVVSPVTDPGCVSAVIRAGLRPVVADAAPGTWNLGAAELEAALSERTRVVVLTHAGGLPVEMDGVLDVVRGRGLRLVEDCSQAHGAEWDGRRVGTFGDAAAFSTMFSKMHATGGCGGLVYTRDEQRYWRVRSIADRGKRFDDPSFDLRDPAAFDGPEMNFNLDELSASIGASTLARLPGMIERRAEIVERIAKGLEGSVSLRSLLPSARGRASYFFHTLVVDEHALRVSRDELAGAVQAEGIPVRSDYRFVVSEWPWLRPHLARERETPEASRFRRRCFNLLFHERFSDEDVDDVVRALRKVEAALVR